PALLLEPLTALACQHSGQERPGDKAPAEQDLAQGFSRVLLFSERLLDLLLPDHALLTEERTERPPLRVDLWCSHRSSLVRSSTRIPLSAACAQTAKREIPRSEDSEVRRPLTRTSYAARRRPP